MSEPENIKKVIAALKSVREKKLLIIELANKVPMKDGQLDYEKLAAMQPEVNMAIAEAKMYGSHTLIAVDTLRRLNAEEKDV